MQKFLMTAALCAGAALAQAADTPVTPQQFVTTEGVQAAYTVRGDQLSPVDALALMRQCTLSGASPVDTNRDGRNDTLRVYGFGIVSAQVYQARGVTALAPAMQKAELRANGAAAEFFGGLRTAVARSLDTQDTTASVVDGGDLKLSNLALETVRESVRTGAQAVLRGGRVTGHRLVSLGTQGLCVVARYELPLDQRSAGAGLPAPRGAALPGGPAPVGSGFPLPPPGTSGDF